MSLLLSLSPADSRLLSISLVSSSSFQQDLFLLCPLGYSLIYSVHFNSEYFIHPSRGNLEGSRLSNPKIHKQLIHRS